MPLTGKARLVVRGNADGPGAFGLGCALLLEGIDEDHSLNRAAKRLGMAYSKAWRLLNEAEDQLGVKLIDRNGARGSALTDAGRRALDGYRTLQGEIDGLVARRLPELLG